MSNRTWPQEHLDLVASWVKTYPKGGSFDIHRVKAERPEEWEKVASSGRPHSAIQHKGYYILHKETHPERVGASRRSKSFNPATGMFDCSLCDRSFAKHQQLGSHVRYHHPSKAKRDAKSSTNHVMLRTGVTATIPGNLVGQMVIVNSDGSVKRAETLNFCPNCGKNVMAHQAAANL